MICGGADVTTINYFFGVNTQQDASGGQLLEDDSTDDGTHADAGQGESRGRQDESDDQAPRFPDLDFDSLLDFTDSFTPDAELSAAGATT